MGRRIYCRVLILMQCCFIVSFVCFLFVWNFDYFPFFVRRVLKLLLCINQLFFHDFPFFSIAYYVSLSVRSFFFFSSVYYILENRLSTGGKFFENKTILTTYKQCTRDLFFRRKKTFPAKLCSREAFLSMERIVYIFKNNILQKGNVLRNCVSIVGASFKNTLKYGWEQMIREQ